MRPDGPRLASYLAASILWLGIIAACWGAFELIRRTQLARAALVMGLAMWALMTFLFSIYAPNTSAFTLAKRLGLGLRAISATQDVRMIEFKEPSLAFYQGGTIREQSENALPDPSMPDSPRWIVISDRPVIAAMSTIVRYSVPPRAKCGRRPVLSRPSAYFLER